MSGLSERLREEMARSVAEVRPAPDPYGRLLRRRGRRGWRWGAAGLGAGIVAVLLGAQALTAGGPGPAPVPAPSYFKPSVGLNEWTRRIIDAPTRGDLAGRTGLVDELRAGLDGARAGWGVDPALDRVKVLAVAEADGERVFGAAFYNATQAQYVSSWAPDGAPVGELVAGRYGRAYGDLGPFLRVGRIERYSMAIAPPGCEVQYSATTTVLADGTLGHVWTRGGEWTVVADPSLVWEVSCDGKLRLHTGQVLGPSGPPARTTPPAAERGIADPKPAGLALASCRSVPGLEVRSWRVLWGGTPPGELRPSVVALGVLDGGAVEVCAATGSGDGVQIDSVHGERPSERMSRPGLARLTKAFAASDGLVAVRLPHEELLQLSDRLLVVGPPGATRLEVSGGPDRLVTLVDGVGVVEAPVPATLSIAALDASGQTVATTRFAEPAGVEHFTGGEPSVWDWD